MATITDVYETIFKVVGGPDLERQLAKVARETKKLSEEEQKAASKQAENKALIGGVTEELKGLALGYFGVQAALQTVNALLDAGKESIKAYLAAETEAFASRSVFRNVEGLSDRMSELATTQSRLTGVDDEFILSQQRMLYSLGANEQQIRRLVPAILDLAAANPQAGLAGTSQAVISALVGRAQALNRLGVEYKRTGNLAKDLLSIERAITHEVGGTAAAFALTDPGRVQRLQTNRENLQEAIGERLFRNVRPATNLGNKFLEDPRAPDVVLEGLKLFFPLLRPIFDVLGRPITEAQRQADQQAERDLLAKSRGGDPQTRLLAEIAANTKATKDAIGRSTLSAGGTLAPGTVNVRELNSALSSAR